MDKCVYKIIDEAGFVVALSIWYENCLKQEMWSSWKS